MDLKLTLVPHAQRPWGTKCCNMIADDDDDDESIDDVETERLHVCMARM